MIGKRTMPNHLDYVVSMQDEDDIPAQKVDALLLNVTPFVNVFMLSMSYYGERCSWHVCMEVGTRKGKRTDPAMSPTPGATQTTGKMRHAQGFTGSPVTSGSASLCSSSVACQDGGRTRCSCPANRASRIANRYSCKGGVTAQVASFEDKRMCAHDEEDDGETPTDSEKVTSESVRWAYDTFNTVINIIVDSCKECSQNGGCEDADGVISNLSSLRDTYHV